MKRFFTGPDENEGAPVSDTREIARESAATKNAFSIFLEPELRSAIESGRYSVDRTRIDITTLLLYPISRLSLRRYRKFFVRAEHARLLTIGRR